MKTNIIYNKQYTKFKPIGYKAITKMLVKDEVAPNC